MYFSVILLYIVVFWRATSLLALGYYVLPSFINKGFIEALRVVLTVIMKNHVFTFDNKIRKQTKGGPIWLEVNRGVGPGLHDVVG